MLVLTTLALAVYGNASPHLSLEGRTHGWSFSSAAELSED